MGAALVWVGPCPSPYRSCPGFGTPVGHRRRGPWAGAGCVRRGSAAVPLLRARMASGPREGESLSTPPSDWGGCADCSTLCPGWGGIHSRSRLGSLTQFRHDKESRGLARRHQPGRSQGGEVAADGADARTSALKSPLRGFGSPHPSASGS